MLLEGGADQHNGKAVLDAEVRIGELMREVPKATTNHKNPDLEIDTAVDFLKKKQKTTPLSISAKPKRKS